MCDNYWGQCFIRKPLCNASLVKSVWFRLQSLFHNEGRRRCRSLFWESIQWKEEKVADITKLMLSVLFSVMFREEIVSVFCPCLHRFDSWAGMALARASRIQDKLNSNELKSDGPIWKHSTPVLNCFKRALEIDSSNLSLWIEYGTISYALHSFASRQLKQWKSELPPEVVQQVGSTWEQCEFLNILNYLFLCSNFLN